MNVEIRTIKKHTANSQVLIWKKNVIDELTIPPVCTKTGIFSWDVLNPSETIVSESVSLLVGNADKELPNSKVASREPWKQPTRNSSDEFSPDEHTPSSSDENTALWSF